jgi:hypothetical protein
MDCGIDDMNIGDDMMRVVKCLYILTLNKYSVCWNIKRSQDFGEPGSKLLTSTVTPKSAWVKNCNMCVSLCGQKGWQRLSTELSTSKKIRLHMAAHRYFMKPAQRTETCI